MGRMKIAMQEEKMKVTVSNISKALKKTIPVVLLCVVLLLSGCRSQKYEQATALFDNGEYAAAYEIFSDIDTYKDAVSLEGDCAKLDIQQSINECDFEAAAEKLEKYSPWQKASWYKRFSGYMELAAAGTCIEQISFERCLLSCTVHMDAPIEGQYLRIRLVAPDSSEIYSSFADTTRANENTAPEDAAEYFDIMNYELSGSYVLKDVNISDFKYTLPAQAEIYDMGIFRPETQALMSSLTFINPYKKVTSVGGTEGYAFVNPIDYALFNGGSIDSISYAFANGTLYLYIMSPDDDILYEASCVIPEI